MAPRTAPAPSSRVYFQKSTIPFWTVHVAAVVLVLIDGWSWTGLLMALATYFVRMFFLTAGYHRYFAHRTYKTSRAFQLVLAVMGQTCAQMGALWWAQQHREHHRDSDGPTDPHSPVRHGFWWSHLGWHMSGQYGETDLSRIPDFARYPELVWLNRRSVGLLPPLVFAIVCGVIGGMHALTWAFFVSTVLLWHGTFTINSLSHVIGSRRYATTDGSRNNWVLALITMGEGWHNNHHHFQSSAAQGFRWWEFDGSYYVLRGLQAIGVVWDLRVPPRHVVHAPRAPVAPPVGVVEPRPVA